MVQLTHQITLFSSHKHRRENNSDQTGKLVNGRKKKISPAPQGFHSEQMRMGEIQAMVTRLHVNRMDGFISLHSHCSLTHNTP